MNPISYFIMATSSMALMFNLIPPEYFVYSLPSIANYVAIATSFLALTQLKHSTNSIPWWLMPAVVLIATLAGISAILSSRDFSDVVFTFRLLAITPLAFMILGWYFIQLTATQIIAVFLPSAALGIYLMLRALQQPFVGELSPGEYVWEEHRFFTHPLTQRPMWPVALSENCCTAFGMTFFLIQCRSIITKLAGLPFLAAAIVVAFVSATRTYLFAFFAVFAIRMIYQAITARKYQQLLIGTVILGLIIGIVFSVPSLREMTIQRVDRFFNSADSSLLSSSGRLDIWKERLAIVGDIGAFSGLGGMGYLTTYSFSSHNLFIDISLIGGWLVGIFYMIASGALCLTAIKLVFSSKSNSITIAIASSLVAQFAIVLVSSPVISSSLGYVFFWLLSGMSLGSLISARSSEPLSSNIGSIKVGFTGTLQEVK